MQHQKSQWEHLINVNDIPTLLKARSCHTQPSPPLQTVTEVQIQPGSELNPSMVGEESQFTLLIAYCTLHSAFLASSSY